MRRMLLLAALCACKPLPPAGPVPVEVAARVAPAVVRLDDGAADVYLTAAFPAGSAYDPLGREGVAQLVASALVEAGTARRTPGEVRDALYVTGNTPEVVVGKEWVTFRLRCHRDQGALCMELFTELLTEPAFDPAEVTRLVDEAAYEVREGARSDEEALAYDVLDDWLFEGHPYGHPTAGREGSLELLDVAAARAFYDRHYVRSAAVLGVAGAANPEAVTDFTERFEALPARPPAELPLMKPVPLKGRSLLFIETGTEAIGFRMGHPVRVTRDHPDYPALLLAFTAFGAHRQSFGTLFRTVRGQRGLNYGTYAYLEPFQERRGAALPEQGVVRRQPFLHLWVRPTAPENAAFALKLTIAELERFVAEGLDDAALEEVRAYLLGALPLLAQDPGRRLAYAVEARAAGLPDPLDALAERLATLTGDEIRQALARHVRPDDLRIVAVGGGGQALLDAVQGGAPTPMTYAAGLQPDEAQAARDAEVASMSLGLDAVFLRPVEGVFR